MGLRQVGMMISELGLSPLTNTQALALAQEADTSALMCRAALLRDHKR
jgi:hypothetical protein